MYSSALALRGTGDEELRCGLQPLRRLWVWVSDSYVKTPANLKAQRRQRSLPRK